MSYTPRRSPRQVVPRWRPWRTTVLLGEARTISPPTFGRTPSSTLSRLLAEYRERPNDGVAAEALGASLIAGDRRAELANLAQSYAESGNELLRELAHRIRDWEEGSYLRGAYEVEDVIPNERIRSLKAVLVREPRNVVRWVDIAREYLSLGQKEQAKKAMKIALAMRPDDRFVLRSATALYAQLDEHVVAINLLERCDRTIHDPWLMAPLMAVRDLAGHKLTGVKHAHHLLEDADVSEHHLAELCAALGTWEIKAGSDRRARQLFRRSVEAPTENALAQVEWAGDRFGNRVFEDVPAQIPRAYEALTRRAATTARWADATKSAHCWLVDQPFSADAAMYGSFVALQEEQWSIAEKFARRGLIANPDSGGVLNNLAYGLAQQNRLAEATELLIRARTSKHPIRSRAFLAATEGLLLFRLGDPEHGRERYRLAMDAFGASLYAEERARAALNLAREEMRAGTEEAGAAWLRAEALALEANSVEGKALRDRLDQLRGMRVTASTSPPSSQVQLRVMANDLLQAPPLLGGDADSYDDEE